MTKLAISFFSLFFIGAIHAETIKGSLQNGIYYIQDGITPQRNGSGEYVLSYRSESINEVYFKVQNNSVASYYYKSGDNWIVGQAEATYNAKNHVMVVNKIAESIHIPSDTTIVKVGGNLIGKGKVQLKKELIPLSGVTDNGFTISCDQYVSDNGIQAFDFPDNYIISPEGGAVIRLMMMMASLRILKLKL